MRTDEKDNLAARSIAREYVKFVKNNTKALEEVKRATVLALKKIMKLKDGDVILIKEDGSLEVCDGEKIQEEQDADTGK